MLIAYGIKNCDTMKKSLKWLDAEGWDYEFHDYKKAGVNRELLEQWLTQVDWEILVNKRGTTWRKLDENTKNSMDQESAVAEMLANPSLIKRPILSNGKAIVVGYAPQDWQEKFA